MFREIFKFLASLQMAIVLLVVIIVATAFGTYYETSFNADVAQKNIYSHWWFNIWLGALCVNLFCVAAIRFPWKRHQTGFVITHAGIITLLLGAMIDRMWGIEGFIHLHTTKAGTNVMELHRQELRVRINGKTAVNHIKVNTIFNPRPLESPYPDINVGISNVLPVAATQVAIPAAPNDPDAKPGLNLTLQGPMMGRNDVSVFFRERESMGPATVAFVAGMPKLSAPDGKDDGADLNLDFQGKSFTFSLKYGEKIEENLEGFPGWKFLLLGYYPNFIMNSDGKPDTRDLRPLNRAACFELVGPEVHGQNLDEDPGVKPDPRLGTAKKQDINLVAPQLERFFVFGKKIPMMNIPIHGLSTGASATLVPRRTPSSSELFEGPNGLAFYLGPDGKLRYFLKVRDRSAPMPDEGEQPKSIEKTGDVELEKPIPVGWGAPGTECVVHDFIENSKMKLIFVPKPDMKKDEEGANQGVECEVTVPLAAVTGYSFPSASSVTINVTSHHFIVGQNVTVAMKPGVKDVDGVGKITAVTPTSITYSKSNSGTGTVASVNGTAGETEKLWIGQTEVDRAFPQEMTVGGMKVSFEFVNECVTIPFTVRLKQFRAPTDEGSNEFAAFESDLLFRDMNCSVTLKKDHYVCESATDAKPVPVSQSFNDPIHYNPAGQIVLEGVWLGAYKPEVTPYNYDEQMQKPRDFKAGNTTLALKMDAIENVEFKDREVQQTISMNKPCIFPNTWYGGMTGVCYKFSQASHHMPQDPGYSGVQVLRDPGWLFKWVGCIMICFGIFTMFYLRPYFIHRPKIAPKPDDAGVGNKKKKNRK